MEERGMNERIRRLRRESLDTPPHIDMERARYFTESYRQYEGEVSVPELRALALKNYFAKKTLYIGCLLYTSPSPRDRQKSRMPPFA